MLSLNLLLSLILSYLAISNAFQLHSSKVFKNSLRMKAYSPSDIGSANMDWPNLGFNFRPTNSFIQCEWKDGKWGPLESKTDPMVKVHIGATALHYGQACFEGLKAFHNKDGKVRLFRPQANAARIAKSCQRICMPEIPQDLFIEACRQAIHENLAFMPPYGTGGAMYIRPVVFGSGARIGLQPSDHYTLAVLVLPVADYYRGGWSPVQGIVIQDYDRAAPRGVGNVKVAGNYAADIYASTAAKKQGYPIALYLDSKTNSCIEEFSTSNFIGIDKNNAYVTPNSDAILESITNLSLKDMARDEGMDVQIRKINVDELVQGNFKEVGAVGTAVVVTPVDKLYYKDHVMKFGGELGITPENSTINRLYKRIRRIQNGEEEDKFNWLVDL